MERDFLSLSYRIGSNNVKEEVNDDSKNSVPERSSGMQWPFSSKVSAVPQLLSFKSPQEDRQRKTVDDPLGPSTLMTISCTDAYDTNQKTFSGAVQRNFIQENNKQASNHYSLTVYNPQEMKIFSNQPNQAIPVAFRSRITSNHSNGVPSTMTSQSFGGLPIVSSVPVVPSNGSVVGTTDLRNTAKPVTAPTQLTIFYGGSVNVYEDISPEKAQAIMLLAGNGSSPSHNKRIPVAPVEVPAPRPTTTDSFIRNWSFSPLPSPVPVTVHANTQSGGSGKINGLAIVKAVVGASGSSSNHQLSEPPKVVGSVGPSTTTAIPTAVPQARNASLARFLEKRKERVISMSPYNLPKKSTNCDAPGYDGMSLSINSSRTSPLSDVN